MDLHPILVHFPIALLTVYAVLEIVRVSRIMKTSWWLPLKNGLLIIGSAASVLAYLSGSFLEEQAESFGEVSAELEIHGTFAALTVACFGILAVARVVFLLRATPFASRLPEPVRVALLGLVRVIISPSVSIPLAIFGLLLLTATGALGGAMVYGSEGDPIARFLYGIFVK